MVKMKEKINVEERVERAVSLFKSGYNCSQSVVVAYADYFGLDEPTAMRVSASFGGGMGRLREVCGAVSGSFMLAGLKYASTDPADKAAKTKNYTVVQELAEKFKQHNGSIICRELLGLARQKDDPVPSDRTPEYYKRRPCSEYVAIAARVIGEKLNEDEEES